jgi:hypothetical protein
MVVFVVTKKVRVCCGASWLSDLREGMAMAGAESPLFFYGKGGTTEVMPCYKSFQ